MSQIFLSNSLKTFKIRIESETTQVHFNKKTFENMKFFSQKFLKFQKSVLEKNVE